MQFSWIYYFQRLFLMEISTPTMPLYNGFLSHLICGKQIKTHVEFEWWAWFYWLTQSSKLNTGPFFKQLSSINGSSTKSCVLTIVLAICNDWLHFQSRSQRKTAKLCARASHDGAVIISLIVCAKGFKIIGKILDLITEPNEMSGQNLPNILLHRWIMIIGGQTEAPKS